jgi:2-polyprenyl-3-methyl-5-hydroxy-6-metoxy-1,4-benzoquinol methylase
MVNRTDADAMALASDNWRTWLARLRTTEWRTPIFFEIVSQEIHTRTGVRRPTVLDIGCGLGFDCEVRYQQALSTQAGRFIGIEPDRSIDPPKVFSEVYQTTLEDAPIAPGSVDVAYAVMVLEHVADPAAFWSRLHEILAPGGVFVAFSVNGAHWFAPIARFMTIVKLKTKYLDLIRGKSGTERYEDYPVYYRTNTVRQIRRHARQFRAIRTELFGATGTVASYAPSRLQPIVRAVDSVVYRLLGQSINIVIRAER